MAKHKHKAATSIRYYRPFYDGIGIIIWAQLLNIMGVDNVIRDGRDHEPGNRILIGTVVKDLPLT